MIRALQNSQDVARESLKKLLLFEHSQVNSLSLVPEETYPTIKTLPSVSILNIKDRNQNVVTFVNSLAHRRTMLVSVMVNLPDVMVN